MVLRPSSALVSDPGPGGGLSEWVDREGCPPTAGRVDTLDRPQTVGVGFPRCPKVVRPVVEGHSRREEDVRTDTRSHSPRVRSSHVRSLGRVEFGSETTMGRYTRIRSPGGEGSEGTTRPLYRERVPSVLTIHLGKVRTGRPEPIFGSRSGLSRPQDSLGTEPERFLVRVSLTFTGEGPGSSSDSDADNGEDYSPILRCLLRLLWRDSYTTLSLTHPLLGE